MALALPLRDGEASGVAVKDPAGETCGYGSSSELSTPHRSRRELYDSLVSNSFSSSKIWDCCVEEEDGTFTRNERYLPAYVRVLGDSAAGGRTGRSAEDDLDENGTGLEGDDGRLGNENVRSMLPSAVASLVIEVSVLERPSIRRASLVGDGEEDWADVIAPKIPDRSRAGFLGLPGDAKGFGGGPSSASSTMLAERSVSSSGSASSVKAGEGVLDDSFWRLRADNDGEGEACSESRRVCEPCLRERLPYVRVVVAISGS